MYTFYNALALFLSRSGFVKKNCFATEALAQGKAKNTAYGRALAWREFYLGNTSENGQRKLSLFKTVGCIYDRYRLGHWWVPETVLNVQSELLVK